MNPYLIPHTKTNSKWIKDLNPIPENIKLLEENKEKLCGIGFGDNFLDMTPKTKATKANKTNGTTSNLKTTQQSRQSRE